MQLLVPTLNPDDYVVTPTLNGVSTWKARIFQRHNDSKDKKKGDFDDVGYVLVRVVGPTEFIPIARADEHHRGFALLNSMRKKWGIQNPNDFCPIFTRGTAFYLYSSEDIPRAVEALKRWHASGGGDLLVKLRYQDGVDDGLRMTISSRDFIAGQGRPVLSDSGILPMGRRFIESLNKIATALADMRMPENAHAFDIRDRSGLRKIEEGVKSCIGIIRSCTEMMVPFHNAEKCGFRTDISYAIGMENMEATCLGMLANQDIHGIEDFFMSHNSVKNIIHLAIKAEMNGERKTDLVEIFGNLESADQEIAAISPGLSFEQSCEHVEFAP